MATLKSSSKQSEVTSPSCGVMIGLYSAQGEMAKIVTMLQTERRKRRSAEEALEKVGMTLDELSLIACGWQVSSESAGQEPSAAASRRLAVHLARHVQDLTAVGIAFTVAVMFSVGICVCYPQQLSSSFSSLVIELYVQTRVEVFRSEH